MVTPQQPLSLHTTYLLSYFPIHIFIFQHLQNPHHYSFLPSFYTNYIPSLTRNTPSHSSFLNTTTNFLYTISPITTTTTKVFIMHCHFFHHHYHYQNLISTTPQAIFYTPPPIITTTAHSSPSTVTSSITTVSTSPHHHHHTRIFYSPLLAPSPFPRSLLSPPSPPPLRRTSSCLSYSRR